MRQRLVHILLAAGLSAGLGSATLTAQTMQVAHIPFAFYVSNRLMPAGVYSIEQRSQRTIFQINDRAGHNIFVTAPNEANGEKREGRLTFLCSGGECALSQIWTQGAGFGYAIPNWTIADELTRKYLLSSVVNVALKPR